MQTFTQKTKPPGSAAGLGQVLVEGGPFCGDPDTGPRLKGPGT